MASSGDMLADRRYAYAEAAFADDDHEAAADLARQTVELVPVYAPAWLLLGRSLAATGDEAGAIEAFRAARANDPTDVLGAGLHLARLGAADPNRAMSAPYVERLFDDYAIRFDRHLRQGLGYRAPELLHDAVRRACSRMLRPFRFGAALDLGCGTGLAGAVFRPQCDWIGGVDLSAAMLRRAEAKRIYDELSAGDLVAWLRDRPDGSADLVLAADVFVYVADLAPVFAAVARTLRPNGLLGFTVQAGEGDGVTLGADHRYAHSEANLRGVALKTGFTIRLVEPASTRRERGMDVPGLLLVLSV